MNDNSALGSVQHSLTTARDSLAGVRMNTPLETIVQHGRAARRRHRLMGLAGTGAVAVTAALALGLTGITGSSTHHTGVIRTAAFTLVDNANGTATLTINPRVLLKPGTLQGDLKQDGIPAIVTVGSFCTSDPPPAGFLRVVSVQPKSQGNQSEHVTDPTVTFNPAAMPAGAELSFGNFHLASGQRTSFTLIKRDSYTCTSTAPSSPPDQGITLFYNHPAS